jgi:hypothetical protein
MEFIARCSKLGDLMTRARAGDGLSETAKTYILENFLYNKYDYVESVTTDAMLKGIMLEDDAAALITEVMNDNQLRITSRVRMHKYGVKYVEDPQQESYGYANDYIKGSPDVILPDTIEDIKVSQNLKTFVTSALTPAYEWQLRGYMWLTGRKHARLIYCMMPDPDWMIARKIKPLTYWEDYPHEMEARIMSNARVANRIPKDKRIRVFEIEHDDDKVEQIIAQVEKARVYFNHLYQTL